MSFFGDSDVERVDLSYHESLQRIVKGDVDAVIWNVVAENELTMLGLEATPLTDDPRFLQATEAVVLTRVMITQCNNCCVQWLINRPCLPINNEW